MNNNIIKSIFSKIILFGLPVFYFLIAVSFYLRTYDSAQIKITITQIGGIFLIFSWLILKLETDVFAYIKKNFVVVLPIILFLLSGIFSFIFSPFKLISSNELIKRIIYCFLAIIVIDSCCNKTNIKYLIRSIIFATWVVVIYGVIQFLLLYLWVAGSKTIVDPFSWRHVFGTRVFSTFANPNFLGDYLIVVAPIILAMFLRNRKKILLLLWSLTVFCIVFSISKGAWLSFGTGLIVFAFLFVNYMLKTTKTKKVALLLILATFTISVVTFGITHQLKTRPDSSSFRLFTWMSCWEMINTHPVLGTGIGTFYVTYPSFRRPQIFFIEGIHNNESDHPENEYLEVFYDEGGVGLGLFLLLLLTTLVIGFRSMNYFRKNGMQDNIYAYIQMAAISALIAQLVHDSMCVSLRFVSSGVMFWLLIGIILSISLKYAPQKNEEEEVRVLPEYIKRLIEAVLFIVIIYFSGVFVGHFIANKIHLQAIGASTRRDYNTSLPKYFKVAKLNPTFPMAYYFISSNYIEQNVVENVQKAEQYFEKLWKLAPNYVQSKYIRGYMYYSLFQYYGNIAKNARENKDRETFNKAFAQMQYYFSLAVKYFNQSKELDPIHFLTYKNLATLYSQTNNKEKAKQEYLEYLSWPERLMQKPYNLHVEDWATRRAREYSSAYVELANIEYKDNNIEKAKEYYLKALDLKDNNIEALKSLTVIYSKTGEKEKYNEVLNKLKELYPEDGYVKELLAKSK